MFSRQYAASGARRIVLKVGAVILSAALCGCITKPSNPAATQPATAVNPATTQPSYWFDKPAPAVTDHSYDRLFDVAQESARDFLFVVDRTDYRAGVITTRPLTSMQWFEFWRRDIRTGEDLSESSLATMRRTIRFELKRLPNGECELSPKVLVERQAVAEQRVTSVVGYRGVFTRARQLRDRPTGTRESDTGAILPARYWYPVSRDSALETALIEDVTRKLGRMARK